MMRKVIVNRAIVSSSPVLTIVLTIVLILGNAAFGNLSISSAASPQHFVGVKPTPLMVDFVGELLIDGKGGKTGNEIAVFNEQGDLCGACVVTKAGQYGILHVYGDDPTTHEREGALPGQKLTFVVWDRELDMEYPVSPAEMAPASASLGSFLPSPLPPVWTADKENYSLNLKVVYESQKNKKATP